MARLKARAQALPTGERPDLGPSPYRDLARLAAERGTDPAFLVRSEGRWTSRRWAEVHDDVLRATAGLVRLGLHPDQVVVSVLPLTHAWPDLELAVRAAGAVLVQVSPDVTAADVAELLDDADVRLVVTDAGSGLDRLAGVSLDRAQVLDLEGGAGWQRLQALGAERLVMDPDVVSRTEAMVDPEDTVARVLVATEDGATIGRDAVGPMPASALSAGDTVLLAGPADDAFVRRVLHEHLRLGFALARVDDTEDLVVALGEVDPSVLALCDASARSLADRLRGTAHDVRCTRLTGVLLAGLPRVPTTVAVASGLPWLTGTVVTELPSAPMGAARLPARPPVVQGDSSTLPRRSRGHRDSAFGGQLGRSASPEPAGRVGCTRG